MSPLITVIIPTYKRRQKVNRALTSIKLQTYKNWEVIVIDNNSKDGTKELIYDLKEKNIKFYEINNKGNISRSRNLGIEKSNGQYIAFLDSDDWWAPNKLEVASKYLNKGYKFMYHDMYVVKYNNLFKTKTKYCRDLNKPIYNDLVENGPAFPTSSVIVEKKLFQNINNFDELKDLITWEDYDAWIRFSKISEDFIKLPGTLGYVSIDDENLLNLDKSIQNIFSFQSKYINNDNLPTWCIFSLIRIYILKKDFTNAKLHLTKLKTHKLNFNLILRYIYFKIRCLAKY